MKSEEKPEFLDFEKFPACGFVLFFMTNRRILMSPGLEPVLLDPEKLFWLSDEGRSNDLNGKTLSFQISEV